MVQADFDLHAHDVQTHPLTNNLPEAEECYRKKGNSPLLNGHASASAGHLVNVVTNGFGVKCSVKSNFMRDWQILPTV